MLVEQSSSSSVRQLVSSSYRAYVVDTAATGYVSVSQRSRHAGAAVLGCVCVCSTATQGTLSLHSRDLAARYDLFVFISHPDGFKRVPFLHSFMIVLSDKLSPTLQQHLQ
jgi:hypothetical protein